MTTGMTTCAALHHVCSETE